jgi:hypothetical protein
VADVSHTKLVLKDPFTTFNVAKASFSALNVAKGAFTAVGVAARTPSGLRRAGGADCADEGLEVG